MPNELLEGIAESIDKAKKIRMRELERFHIGDVVFPLYQMWEPLLWGIVTDIGLTTHKITVNINGVLRQYDPEELIMTNPELKQPNRNNEDKKRIEDEIQRTVNKAFRASKTIRIARRLMNAKD